MFQPVFCLQSLPKKACEAGYNAGMGRSFPMGVTRKLHPKLRPQSGIQFPHERRSGKCIPDCSLRMGCSFRNAVLAETVSRN